MKILKIMILSTIPLSILGVLIGHMVMGINISMPSLIGMIGLAGVIVNDGIIMMEFIMMEFIKKAKNDAWSASVRTLYQQASYPTGAFGTGYNLQKNKITLTTNFTYSDGSNAPFESSVINYPNITWKEENKRRDFSKSLSGRIGLDYKISQKISTGFLFNIVKSNPKINS